jgi:ubiquinone/menaquinone biosynthesis C-methylase UbiE
MSKQKDKLTYNDIVYTSSTSTSITNKTNNYTDKLTKHLLDDYILSVKFTAIRSTKHLLDIGCGKGTQLDSFRKLTNFKLHGIDHSEQNSQILEGIEFNKCDLERQYIPYEDNKFDVIYSKSVLEHINKYTHMITEMKRVLKPGGILIIMVPDWQTQYKHFYDDWTHVTPWTLKGLTNCLRYNGFDVIKSESMYQLPFTWKYPRLKIIPKIISLLPDSWKWNNLNMSSGQDRKLIRFSKEKMILIKASK